MQIISEIIPNKQNECLQNSQQIEFKSDTSSINNDELPSAEKIVEMILLQDKNDYQERAREMKAFSALLKKYEPDWEKEKPLYIKIERWVQVNKNKITGWKIAGPLHYGMSLDEMKIAITNKFREMILKGNLITEEKLLQNYNRQDFYPPSKEERNDLTRLWGAEFIKENLLNETKLDVSEHVLILDKSTTEIEIKVFHGEYPYLSNIKNAYILSKKIEGIPKAWDYRFSSTLDRLQYRDFKDPGNIICDSNGVGWIVDTELKGFDAPKLDRHSYIINAYLKKRFKVLTGENYQSLYQTFKISINNL